MDKCGLTLSQLRYLAELVERNIDAGEYWGNRDQFIKRQVAVWNWINHHIWTLTEKERP